jgi:tetrahydromethanopterin S-methyltransferase subunit G
MSDNIPKSTLKLIKRVDTLTADIQNINKRIDDVKQRVKVLESERVE